MRWCRFVVAVLVAGAPSALAPQSTRAQVSGAQILQIPPDVRAEGMGRVWAPLSTSPYAVWGNAAGLGFAPAGQFARMDAQLVPGLADDVYYDFTAVSLGLDLPRPVSDFRAAFGFQRTHLDYGESIATGVGPEPFVAFDSWETTTGAAFAAGYRQLLAAGVGFKHVEVSLAPAWVAQGAGGGESTALDFGLMARTPHLGFRGGRPALDWRAAGNLHTARARLLGGTSWSNYGHRISLSSDREGDPLPRVRRESVGLELDLLPAVDVFGGSFPFLARFLRDVHVVSFAGGFGRDKNLLAYDIPDSLADDLSKNEREGIVTYKGWEVRFLDCFSYREGEIFDDPGGIKDSTKGWGASFFGYAGVDFAEIPQYGELDHVEKWSFWVRIPLD